MSDQPRELNNLVELWNYDTEDFIFRVNSEPYIIRKGERRTFLKSQANLATKHFVDRMCLKKDPEGKLLSRQDIRAEIAAKFVVREQKFERPQMPTDRELVDEINKKTDLEAALENKTPTTESPELTPNYAEVNTAAGVPPAVANSNTTDPVVDTTGVPTPPVEVIVDTSGVPAPNTKVVNKDTSGVPPANEPIKLKDNVPSNEVSAFEEEDSKTTIPADEAPAEMPSRDEMMIYAKETLMLDTSNKKVKARLDKLSDEELYNELQIGQ